MLAQMETASFIWIVFLMAKHDNLYKDTMDSWKKLQKKIRKAKKPNNIVWLSL